MLEGYHFQNAYVTRDVEQMGRGFPAAGEG